jgi:hypothetical protein
MTKVLKMTRGNNLVCKRLEQGIYEYPDPDWVQRYNDKYLRPIPGKYNCMPAAAWWWAVLSVADFYKVDPNSDAMHEHYDEARELHAAYVIVKAPGTEEPKRFT